MSELTIEKDIEFIKNQVNYLDTFQKKITVAFSKLENLSTYFKGPQQDERVYIEIDRWLKCYLQLREHLTKKNIIDDGLKKEFGELPLLNFIKPTISENEIKEKGGAAKMLYSIFPPYRISYNKKKVKQIKTQINEYKHWVEKMRKLSFNIERVYTEGI